MDVVGLALASPVEHRAGDAQKLFDVSRVEPASSAKVIERPHQVRRPTRLPVYARKQLGERNVQRVSERCQRLHVSDAFSALYHRETGDADPRSFRQIFLRPPFRSLGSQLANPLP